MPDKKLFLVLCVSICGCSGMQWHDGAMIKYQNIDEKENNQYSIEVLGSSQHNQDSLEAAVLKKAVTICKGDAEIVYSTMGTYFTSTTGGGLNFSGNAPKITSVFECISGQK